MLESSNSQLLKLAFGIFGARGREGGGLRRSVFVGRWLKNWRRLKTTFFCWTKIARWRDGARAERSGQKHARWGIQTMCQRGAKFRVLGGRKAFCAPRCANSSVRNRGPCVARQVASADEQIFTTSLENALRMLCVCQRHCLRSDRPCVRRGHRRVPS